MARSAVTLHTVNGVTSLVPSARMPDGTLEIVIDDDPHQVYLSVQVRDSSGRFVISAHHTHSRHDVNVPFLIVVETVAEAPREVPGEDLDNYV